MCLTRGSINQGMVTIMASMSIVAAISIGSHRVMTAGVDMTTQGPVKVGTLVTFSSYVSVGRNFQKRRGIIALAIVTVLVYWLSKSAQNQSCARSATDYYDVEYY